LSSMNKALGSILKTLKKKKHFADY
jgi:hypothetical protein